MRSLPFFAAEGGAPNNAPRTPARIAARIDRLSRVAHRFHRFAHHPLCEEYRGEVVRFGRRARVCRGCLFAAAGGTLGGVLSIAFATPLHVAAASLGLGLAIGAMTTLAPSSRRDARGGARPPKTLSRALPATMVGYGLGSAVQLGFAGLMLAAMSGVLLAFALRSYRKRGVDRTPCTTCPERTRPSPCRGLAPIVRRERAFRRLAGALLQGSR
jgi:hypothetical protein